ncbi:MAG: hypothetical protein JXX29_04200 [Deltaproteobacteria bacterium]|nr:hypothetical protein [Deltaproteobacteria bacterium]MBN2670846.1 hypothetical protein [Deltaproteobacteria bacterium]
MSDSTFFTDTEEVVPSDTPEDVEQILIEGYRNMPASKKLHRIFDLSLSLKELAKKRIVMQYGDQIPQRLIMLKLASLYLDQQTMQKAFNYDPTQEEF